MAIAALLVLLLPDAATARSVSWWWDGRPSRKPNASALLNFVARHQSKGIVTSVILNCGFRVQDNGTLSGDVSAACQAGFHGLQKVGVGAELWLGEQDSIDAAHKMFSDPKAAAASLVGVIKTYGLVGINFDLEPHSSTKADAALYAKFLRAIRPAVNGAGARLTVDSALWTPMLAEMSAYQDAVDRVMYMHTYYAGSLEQWLEYLAPALDVPRAKLAAGLAVFHDARTAGWADTAAAAKERLCWLSNQSVPEVALFRILNDATHEWPDPYWIEPLQAYASGAACDPGPAPTGGCPKGWQGPDSQGCCERHYSASCNEACAKDECAHYKRGWWWKPEDYHHHPYTCCAPNRTASAAEAAAVEAAAATAAALAPPVPVPPVPVVQCAGRQPWMEGTCKPLPLGSSTPETRANDARNGSLALGANLYEVHVPPATPFFSLRLHVVKGSPRCVGKFYTSRAPGEAAFSAKVNHTSAEPPMVLNNVAGSGGAPTEEGGKDGQATPTSSSTTSASTAWTVALYFPYQDESPPGERCSFVLSVDALAPPSPLSTMAQEITFHPAALPLVFLWNETIAQPETIRAAAAAAAPAPAAAATTSSSPCNLVVSVRGPADMFGNVAQWDGAVVPTSNATDLFASIVGFAGGTWAMSIRLDDKGATSPCKASFWRHQQTILPIADATAGEMTRVPLSENEKKLLSLPHGSPPYPYAALDIQILAGACKGVSLAWLADKFQTNVGPYDWAMGMPVDPMALWPSTFDPSVMPGSQRGAYLIALTSTGPGSCTVGMRAAKERRFVVRTDETWFNMGVVADGELVILHRANQTFGAVPAYDIEMRLAHNASAPQPSPSPPPARSCSGEFAAFVYPNGPPFPAVPVRLGPLWWFFKQTILVGPPPAPHAALIGAFRAFGGACDLQVRVRPNMSPGGGR